MESNSLPGFNPGEMVQLRSGGPQSTVVRQQASGLVEVIYFSQVSGKVEHVVAPAACFRLASYLPANPAGLTRDRQTGLTG